MARDSGGPPPPPGKNKKSCPRRCGSLLEMAVAEVVEQLILLLQRITILWRLELFDQMHRTVCRHDVEPAVVVIVEENRAKSGERNARCGDARLDAPIFEIALAAIDKQCTFLTR